MECELLDRRVARERWIDRSGSARREDGVVADDCDEHSEFFGVAIAQAYEVRRAGYAHFMCAAGGRGCVREAKLENVTTWTEESRAGGIVARASTVLDGLLPRRFWRAGLAFASGFLTYACTTAGLFLSGPEYQSAVVAGTAVGLVAPNPASAAAAAAAAAIGARLLGPVSPWSATASSQLEVAEILLAGSACAVVGLVVRAAISRWKRAQILFLAAAIAILVANLWFTVLSVNRVTFAQGVPSFEAQLAGNIPDFLARTDPGWFYHVQAQVRSGEPYYEAFNQAILDNPGWDPKSVADFRVPTIFWLWGTLPDARYVVLAFLVLASIAVVSVVAITAASVRVSLAVPGCAALAAYLLFFPTGLVLFQLESWGGMIGVLAIAAHAISMRSRHWRVWAIASVVLAVASVLVRETMAFLPIAGLASALVSASLRRRYLARAWSLGIALLIVAYLGHYATVKHFLIHTGELPRVGRGDVSYMLAAFRFGTDHLGGAGWLPVVLSVLGLVGAALTPDVRQRTLVLLSIGLTAASFLVLGNRAAYGTGGGLNYWGASLLPLVYSLVPVAFVIVPGAGRAGASSSSISPNRVGVRVAIDRALDAD